MNGNCSFTRGIHFSVQLLYEAIEDESAEVSYNFHNVHIDFPPKCMLNHPAEYTLQ